MLSLPLTQADLDFTLWAALMFLAATGIQYRKPTMRRDEMEHLDFMGLVTWEGTGQHR